MVALTFHHIAHECSRTGDHRHSESDIFNELTAAFWNGAFPHDALGWDTTCLDVLYGRDDDGGMTWKEEGLPDFTTDSDHMRWFVFELLVSGGDPAALAILAVGNGASIFRRMAAVPWADLSDRARTVIGHITVDGDALARWGAGRPWLCTAGLVSTPTAEPPGRKPGQTSPKDEMVKLAQQLARSPECPSGRGRRAWVSREVSKRFPDYQEGTVSRYLREFAPGL
ncbi:MAG: hypothetical protein FD149_2235 [Rhodospirillaceae bacterium]|nr:MAG: hypothetical protein FD149_2235 [Rhodospirillaceae bacterium]